MTMKRYSVFLPDQLKEAIEAKAAKTGTPTAEHIRAAIAAYCEPKPQPGEAKALVYHGPA